MLTFATHSTYPSLQPWVVTMSALPIETIIKYNARNTGLLHVLLVITTENIPLGLRQTNFSYT